MSLVPRVYLIDTDRRIRNIYSAGFLRADMVINDINTVIMAEGSSTQAASTPR